jgi:hypothetical protein
MKELNKAFHRTAHKTPPVTADGRKENDHERLMLANWCVHQDSDEF